jgi:hypothetical protein
MEPTTHLLPKATRFSLLFPEFLAQITMLLVISGMEVRTSLAPAHGFALKR